MNRSDPLAASSFMQRYSYIEAEYMDLDAKDNQAGWDSDATLDFSDPHGYREGIRPKSYIGFFCAGCGVNGCFEKCRGCKMTTYCSTECHRVHWRAGHAVQCRQVQYARIVKKQAKLAGTKKAALRIKNLKR